MGVFRNLQCLLSLRFSSAGRGVLAACSFVALLAAPTVGSATTLNATDALGTYQFSLSDAFGSGNFGTVTISSLGGTKVDIAVNVAPNYLLDTGSHELFTFSLATGRDRRSWFADRHRRFTLHP